MRGQSAIRLETSVETATFGGDNRRLLAGLQAGGHLPDEVLDRCQRATRALAEAGLETGLAEALVGNGVLSPNTLRSIADAAAAPLEPDLALDDSGHFPSLSTEPAPAIVRLLEPTRLGRLAVAAGRVAEIDVDEALAAQILLRELGLRLPLGQVLVRRGLLDGPALDALLAEQVRARAGLPWAEMTDLDPADDGLARFLAERGGLSAAQVAECRFIRSVVRDFGLGRDLLGVAHDRGFIDRRGLRALRNASTGPVADDAIPAPLGATPRPPAREDLRLGRLLVHNRMATPEQIDDAVGLQTLVAAAGHRIRLGTILLERRLVDRRQLLALLKAQAEGRGLRPDEADLSIDLVKFTAAEEETLARRLEEAGGLAPDAAGRCQAVRELLESHGIRRSLPSLALEMDLVDRSVAAGVLEQRETARQRVAVVAVDTAADAMDDLLEDSGAYRSVRGAIDARFLKSLRRFRLGRLATGRRLAGPEQVREGLRIQLRLRELGVDRPLGAILVERGHLERPDLRALLRDQRLNRSRAQWARLEGDETLDPSTRRLGEFLIAHSILPIDQVHAATYAHWAMSRFGLETSLGEVLALEEFMDREVIEAIERRLEEAPATEESAHYLPSAALREAYREILSHVRGRRGLDPLPVLGRRPSPARASGGARSSRRPPWLPVVAAVGLIGLVVGGLVALPAMLRPRPLAPDMPPPAEVETLRPEGTPVALVGVVVRVGFYPGPDGRPDQRFDLVLATGHDHQIVRGAAPPADLRQALERARATGRPVTIVGTQRVGRGRPAVTLPDGTRTRAWIEFENLEEEP